MPQDVRELNEIPSDVTPMCQVTTSTGAKILAESIESVWKKVFGSPMPKE